MRFNRTQRSMFTRGPFAGAGVLTSRPSGTRIALSASSIVEGSANNTVVGTASLHGPYSGTPSWSIADADTTFKINSSTGVISVNNNTDLVWASHPSIAVTISVSGTTPAIADAVTTISVTLAFFARLDATPVGDNALAYEALFLAKAANPTTFAKLDALYIFGLAAGVPSTARKNLLQDAYNLTESAGMIYGPDVGYTSDQSSGAGYLDSGFVPSTAAGKYALGDCSMGAGILNARHNLMGFNPIGTSSSDFSEFDSLNIAQTDNDYGCELNGVGVSTATPANTQGGWIGTLTGSTVKFYHDGTEIGSGVDTPVKLPDGPIAIAALYVAGGRFNNSGDTIGWAFFGGGLNAGDVAILTAALAALPLRSTPIKVAALGYDNIFNYDFAASGLSGLDVNGTFDEGYSFYSSWWNGAQAPAVQGNRGAPASAYSYDSSKVIVGNAEDFGWLSTRGDTSSAFEATASDTILTVSSVLYGPILAGQVVAGNAALSGQTIVAQLSGSPGDTGSYRLSASASIASAAKLMGNSSVGVAPFAAGGYYEIEMSFDEAQDTGANFFPSAWINVLDGSYSSNLTAGYGEAAHWGELDIVEAKSGSRAKDMNAFDWTNIDGGQGPANLGVSNFVREFYPTVTDGTVAHKYGMLWLTSAENAGTGLIEFYLDGVHLTDKDISYSAAGVASPAASPANPAGVLSVAESGQFVLLIGSGGLGGDAYPANLISANHWH